MSILTTLQSIGQPLAMLSGAVVDMTKPSESGLFTSQQTAADFKLESEADAPAPYYVKTMYANVGALGVIFALVYFLFLGGKTAKRRYTRRRKSAPRRRTYRRRTYRRRK